MKLTGQCKKDFEKWYDKLPLKFHSDIKGVISGANTFYRLPESMQFGVFVDFFDSVGIEIEVYKDYDMSDSPATFSGWIYYFEQDDNNKWFETRQEANTKAIEKINELYNNRLK